MFRRRDLALGTVQTRTPATVKLGGTQRAQNVNAADFDAPPIKDPSQKNVFSARCTNLLLFPWPSRNRLIDVAGNHIFVDDLWARHTRRSFVYKLTYLNFYFKNGSVR